MEAPLPPLSIVLEGPRGHLMSAEGVDKPMGVGPLSGEKQNLCNLRWACMVWVCSDQVYPVQWYTRLKIQEIRLTNCPPQNRLGLAELAELAVLARDPHRREVIVHWKETS